jgi:SAM-dependent methyltransferase
MDDPAQARAYAEADFAEVNQGFVDRFAALWPDWAPGPVLDLGCGPADVPLRFARAHPEATVVGVDAAAAMLGLADRSQEGADRVHLVQAHLPRVGLAEGTFAAVLSNSLLHHLLDPLDLWRAVKACGAPGAPVLVCDLFRPDSEAAAQRIVDEADCSDDPILRHDFFHSLLAAYTVDEVRRQVAEVGLDLEVAQVTERHLLVNGVI